MFNPTKLVQLRKARGLSREQVAVGAGRAYESIAKIERGHVVPSSTTVGAIARVLGCRVSDLFDDGPERDDVPSDLGADTDAWIKATLARAPAHLTEEQARRISLVMFGSAVEQ